MAEYLDTEAGVATDNDLQRERQHERQERQEEQRQLRRERVQTRARGWVFTINNWSIDDVERLEAIECTYMVYGEETGESGTPHLQGFVYYPRQISFTVVVRQLGGGDGRAHVERLRGTPKQAADYCKKDGTYHERGTCPEQGRRNDIDTARDLIKAGGSIAQAAEVVRSYQALRFAILYRQLTLKPRRWKPEVFWFWGRTGSGKTRLAWELLGDEAYAKTNSDDWFEGYDGQLCVIFDELREHTLPFAVVLGLLDRYPYRVKVKGGSSQFRARRIIVTSSVHPLDVWQRTTGEDRDQLTRRIDRLVKFPLGAGEDIQWTVPIPEGADSL